MMFRRTCEVGGPMLTSAVVHGLELVAQADDPVGATGLKGSLLMSVPTKRCEIILIVS